MHTSLGKVWNKWISVWGSASLCYSQSQTTPRYQRLIIRVHFTLTLQVHQWPATAFIWDPVWRNWGQGRGRGEPLPTSESFCPEAIPLSPAHIFLTKASMGPTWDQQIGGNLPAGRGVLLKEPATSVQTGGKQRCKATWGSSWHADRQTVVMGLEETKARVVFIILVWSYAMLCF